MYFLDEEYEEYDDLFPEPSAAEEIIQKAELDLRQVFSDRIKNLMGEAAGLSAKVKALEMEIGHKQWELQDLSERQKRAEAKIDEYDRHHLPREFVGRIVTELTGGFVPGDKVWVIKSNWNSETCPQCKGKKQLLVEFDGSHIGVKCPTCDGTGRYTFYTYEPVEKTVTDVHLTLCFDSHSVNRWSNEVIELTGENGRRSCEHIYRTKEECEAAIERRVSFLSDKK